MDLKIKGNFIELSQTIESFKRSARIELIHKKSRQRKIIGAILIGVLIFELICLYLVYGILQPLFAFVFLIVFSCANFFVLLLLVDKLFPDGFLKTAQIEERVTQSANNMYGNRLELLRCFQNGLILSSKILHSHQSSRLHSKVCFLFEYVDVAGIVHTIELNADAAKTTDSKFKNQIVLDLESGYAVYYYQDELSGVELNIINQFLPKGNIT